MRYFRSAVLLLVCLSLIPIMVEPAYGHAFGRLRDLPIPVYLYWFGGASVVVLSFVLISLLATKKSSGDYRTINLMRNSFFGWLVHGGFFVPAIRALSVFFLALVIASGLFGIQVPLLNFTPTFVWVVWWIGFGFLHALIGNVWNIVNPWRASYEWLSKAWGGIQPRVSYPKRLGVLPAFILFILFVWIELVFPDAASPLNIALLTIAYTIITWLSMYLFGMHVWLRFGEAFSVFFRFLSMLGPSEVRVRDKTICRTCNSDCLLEEYDCINCYECSSRAKEYEVNLRPYVLGLIRPGRMRLDRVAFILLMLSSVTFDGVSRTITWYNFIGVDPFGPSARREALVYLNTAGLVGFFALFMAIYYGFMHLVRRFSRSPVPLGTVMLFFASSLLPIAMVYQFSHYTSFFILQGQETIKLFSDPFGLQWNLFGTRDFPVIPALDFLALWNYQVVLIVVGHIFGIYIAHLNAMNVFRGHGSAVRSQYPMLALMVIYTTVGLWLLSAPSLG